MGLMDNLASLQASTQSNLARHKDTVDSLVTLASSSTPDPDTPQNPAPTTFTFSGAAVSRRLGAGIPGGKLVGIGVGKEKWTVAANAAPAFKKFLDEITKRGYKVHSSGGYVNRDIRGRPGVKSEHAYGRAIDINAESNPMLVGKLVTDMPSWVPQIAAKYGLEWGGNWKKRKDPMHFEYRGK